jgi:hypothetical protein
MPDSDATPPSQFLRCAACGRAVTLPAPELAALIADGWPVCCGLQMALHVAAVPTKLAPGPGPV